MTASEPAIRSSAGGDALARFKIERHRAAPAIDKICVLDAVEIVALARRLTVDANDIGAEVRKQHADERPGPDARHLDHPKSRQRPHRSRPPLAGAVPSRPVSGYSIAARVFAAASMINKHLLF